MNNTIQYNKIGNHVANGNIIKSIEKVHPINIINGSNVTEESNKTDTIDIHEKNENAINAKKAKDALKDTLSEFSGKLYPCGSGLQDITGVLIDLKSMAETEGITIPLGENFNTGSSFINYVDELMNFAKNLSKTRSDLVPSDFLTFCEKFKENLIKYNCK
ncbi:hypothetical protein [Clostridium sp.]|uniref:hypothetical protein n=1 Tax=Clostridium sp. TaxID=1506 RepID=UPI0034643322